MILLSGRIAEELFFGKSITTGAINDFDEATKLAQKMIVYYGMGNKIIYPNSSDKYKEMIDTEIFTLINDAHQRATFIIKNTKELILESSFILMKEKTLNLTDINALIAERYPNILNINI
jgi:ATP-dependent Zn protease